MIANNGSVALRGTTNNGYISQYDNSVLCGFIGSGSSLSGGTNTDYTVRSVRHLDVLTNTDIIVIRDMNCWAEGLGMLDAFSTQFPNKTKHLHLYNTHLNNDLLNKIITLTTQLAITLTIEQ
mgnify:CR=1 FL=1